MTSQQDSVVEDEKEILAPNRSAFREARWMVEEFHYDYAANLERFDVMRWPEFFTEDAVYNVVARDNAESGLRLGLIYCDGMGMLKDRAYALKHTEMYAPRYLNLHINNVRIMSIEDSIIRAESNYLLLETLIDEPTRVQQVGKYYDRFQRKDGRLLIKERQCVYDTVLINNCLVLPV
jgi:anthranilate 1,2-dioxygenase small subunit